MAIYGRRYNLPYFFSFCLHFVACLLLIFIQFKQAVSTLPRGVRPNAAGFYLEDDLFTCFSWDGSKPVPSPIRIARDKVNDDYCDCPDGSDEPGTSACQNGSFFCENRGFLPMQLISSRVNDGICDCCDGSDEYASDAICNDECSIKGIELKQERERRKLLLLEGNKIYTSYCEKGTAHKKQQEERLIVLKKELEETEKTRDELQNVKDEVEIPEKAAKAKHEAAWQEQKEKLNADKNKEKAILAFQDLDTDSNKIVSVSEMQKHLEFDIDRNGEVSYEESKEYLEDMEEVDEERFLEKVWPSIKEIYVVPTKEPEKKKGDDEDEIPPPPIDDEDIEEHTETPVEDEHKNKESDDTNTNAVDDLDLPMPEYDSDTKALIEAADVARKQLEDAENKVKDFRNQVTDIENDLKLDYGLKYEFQPVKENGCVEYTDREYTYKLCLFEKASQRPKDGGVETNLGVWGKWDGPEANKYSIMKYEKGQGCWNGPDRSVKVLLECGTENKVISASEPSRCEYEFIFVTPSVCVKSFVNDNELDPEHDEL